jgi:hypothetical protein
MLAMTGPGDVMARSAATKPSRHAGELWRIAITARLISNVCARHGTELTGCRSPCLVSAEPKARSRARASGRGSVHIHGKADGIGGFAGPPLYEAAMGAGHAGFLEGLLVI